MNFVVSDCFRKVFSNLGSFYKTLILGPTLSFCVRAWASVWFKNYTRCYTFCSGTWKNTASGFLFFSFFLCFFFCYFFFLGLYLLHMEVPRLGVKSELQLPAYSISGSKLSLRPTPQLMATPDPKPTEQGQGSNPHPHGYSLGLLPLSHDRNSL